jgi:uncharacterized protein (TIRG00374 family)
VGATVTDTGGPAARWFVDRRTALKIGLGFVVAVVLIYLLGAVVGWERTVEGLRMADPWWVLAALASTVLGLVAWGKTWQVVLSAVGVSVRFRKLVVTFFAATFANYVTPMGQAGGEPFIAFILSRDTDADFEQSLASVGIADVLRILPFLNVGLVGLGYLVWQADLPEGLEVFAYLLVAFAVAMPLGVVLAWRYRAGLRRGVLWGVGPLTRRTERYSRESIDERIGRLYESLDVIRESPRELAVAVVFAYVGWVFFALPLYFSGLALELFVPLWLVCFLVPIAVIAGSTPLPGGLAAIEGTLVALLVALRPFTGGEALAVTTVYRLTSYWFVVVFGGLAALWVLYRA